MSNSPNSPDPESITRIVTRTLAANRHLDVDFVQTDRPALGQAKSAQGAHVQLPAPKKNNAILRGYADSAGFTQLFHNPAHHQAARPHAAESAALFDTLESLRCKALGVQHYPGSARNISAALSDICKRSAFNTEAPPTIPDMAQAVDIAGFNALTQSKASKSVKDSLKHCPPFLQNADWSTLQACLSDQDAFAQQTLQLLQDWGLDTKNGAFDTPDTDESNEENAQDDTPATEDTSPDTDGSDDADQAASSDEASASDTDAGTSDGLGEDQDAEPADTQPDTMPASEHQQFAEAMGMRSLYHIYTSEFDQILGAESLADPIELTRLRRMLDRQLDGSRALIAKLANRLQRKIMALQQRRWKFDLEEGILDGSRLARIIANPSVPLTFKQETQDNVRDTVVSLLIDNSGSMRGRPIALAAMSTDIIAQTLERCNVKVEILGFTTRAWKGGDARNKWIENDRPANPGRLNDLRHIIYKSADTPMRRAHKNLGLMLKEGLLKENIDGEALAWGYNRLARRAEERKILIVISDGAPVDDSTLSANQGNILEDDLRAVIGCIETNRDVELSAIGIGHDVSRYYKRAITITDAEQLGKALVDRLGDLFL